MFRSLVLTLLATTALLIGGCGPLQSDYGRGVSDGRQAVREARQEARKDGTLSGLMLEGGLQMFATPPHIEGESADYNAGFRKGFEEEIKNP